MTLSDGLVVVVPRGFDQEQIPGILERKRPWIERASARAQARRAETPSGSATELPEGLLLRCLGAEWRVDYAPVQGSRSGREDHGPGVS